MKHSATILAVALSIAGVAGPLAQAKEKVLSQDAVKQLLAGNTGRHWSLDDERWYVFNWHRDGELTISLPNAAPDDEPVEKGTWRVKEIKPKAGDDPEEIKRRNEDLSHLYCHTLEKWTSGNELCFELVQETFYKDGNSEDLAATQEYKYYREAGAETGAFTITSK